MEKIVSDLTVVGGGMAGVSTALAAARHGLKVALVNDRPVLGGNTSSELRVHFNGAAGGQSGYNVSHYAREGGIADELKLTIFQYNPNYNQKYHYELSDGAVLDLVYKEKNITLFLNTMVYKTHVHNGNIVSCIGRQFASERTFEFISPYFADCSGDSVLGYDAGALFRVGREGRDEFHESLAPLQGDKTVMGSSILFMVRNFGKPVTYRKPDFAYEFEKLPFFENLSNPRLNRNMPEDLDNMGGLWWLEYGGHLDTIRDNEEITLELRKIIYGFWDYIKNSGKFTGVENLAIDWIAPFPGKRESRRLVGDYILNQNDIAEKKQFPDAIAVGGWPMDLHAPKGVYDPAPATEWNFVPGLYQIPYRVAYSQNINNLFMAGRNISVSHAALSSTRIMMTCSAVGQAAGTAAAICKKYGITPREIYSKGFYKELQAELLRDGQTIIGLSEDTGLAKEAKVTASSWKKYENTEECTLFVLQRDVSLILPLKTERLDSAEVYIRAQADTEFKVTVMGGRHKENYMAEYKIKEIELPLTAGFEGWLKLPLNAERGKDSKIHLVFRKNDAVSIGVNSRKLTGAVSVYFQEDYDFVRNDFGKLLCFQNLLPQQEMYLPSEVTNHYSRPYGTPNLWIAEKVDGEWLALTFEQPQSVGSVQIVFNSQLESDHFDEPIYELMKDYDAEIYQGETLTKTIPVRDNYLTRNEFAVQCDNVTKILFRFHATYGAEQAEVFSVKVFE